MTPPSSKQQQPDVEALQQVAPQIPAKRVAEQPELDPPPAGAPRPRRRQRHRQDYRHGRQSKEPHPPLLVEIGEDHQPPESQDEAALGDHDPAITRRSDPRTPGARAARRSAHRRSPRALTPGDRHTPARTRRRAAIIAAARATLRGVRMTDRPVSSSSEPVLKASSRPNGISPIGPRTSTAAKNAATARTVNISLRRQAVRPGAAAWSGPSVDATPSGISVPVSGIVER